MNFEVKKFKIRIRGAGLNIGVVSSEVIQGLGIRLTVEFSIRK